MLGTYLFTFRLSDPDGSFIHTRILNIDVKSNSPDYEYHLLEEVLSEEPFDCREEVLEEDMAVEIISVTPLSGYVLNQLDINRSHDLQIKYEN
jgi:hypothetical protein